MKVDDDLVRQVIRPRLRESHKGSYGRVLLVGGLYPYGGAIIMAAIACVNSGAGLVTVATDRENIIALHAHLPEAMAFDLRETERFLDNLRAADVILIGSGLGEEETADWALELVLANIRSNQNLVVDGSALNLLAKKNQSSLPKCHLIFTPHQKEWERLSGLAISEQSVSNTQRALEEFQSGTILVAKSHKTAVYQGAEVTHLEVGGPYQATGGMGDTLAGMVAGFLAQFASTDSYKAVIVATWLHSAIADNIAENAYVVLPTRISKAIPSWMKKLSL
ncbi:NAD(P)HX dehydratase [Streptococcus thermophilus]|uniref:NAD(P)H-hydrate dehydratase n=1 Tax=Streptococcus thermophilus TaxID=1308 RepID=UPI000EB678CC|nr:NAD(P)H-hydrate dehydratase [Streptococcus thermophilus]AXT15157.1 NAD(P)H-hydrate dehydratase [Streptococcus thermophilus]UTS67527.1 NAD(P)HX dehydratase [Streptococcus thermophilus]